MSEMLHSLMANTSHTPHTDKPASHALYQTIENKTVRRIAIAVKASHVAQHPGRILILPPLGRRRLPAEELDIYEWEAWECRGLVQIEAHIQRTQKASRQNLVFWLSIALCVCLLGSLAIWLLQTNYPAGDSTTIWVGAGLTLIALLSLITALQGWAVVWRSLTESLGWLGVILVGAAFPTAFMAQQWDPSKGSELQKLILFTVVVLFTSITATLPAALYFLFKREHIRTLRRKFLLEIMRLCPVVQTTDDVEELYGPSLDDAQGATRLGSRRSRPIFRSGSARCCFRLAGALFCCQRRKRSRPAIP